MMTKASLADSVGQITIDVSMYIYSAVLLQSAANTNIQNLKI